MGGKMDECEDGRLTDRWMGRLVKCGGKTERVDRRTDERRKTRGDGRVSG